jgi:hypothetical protein
MDERERPVDDYILHNQLDSRVIMSHFTLENGQTAIVARFFLQSTQNRKYLGAYY